MIKDLIENFIQRWQDKCPHDNKYVKGDILSGSAWTPGVWIHWCYRCGAYWVQNHRGEIQQGWTKPKAAWARRAGL